MSVTEAIVVESVNKCFGGLTAVRDVSLGITDGERHALIGPNGAGKTTLFNLIAGDIPVTSGSIRLFGEEVTFRSVRYRARRGLRRTYQTSALFDELTVAENLYLSVIGPTGVGHYSVLASAEAKRKSNTEVARIADDVGLTGRMESPTSELSHGERRQLEVGLALAANPRMILLDEPAAGLSPSERQHMTELIRSLPDSVTVLVIEHDMDVALTVAQRVTVLNEGEVLVEDTPDKIRSNKTVQALYLGEE